MAAWRHNLWQKRGATARAHDHAGVVVQSQEIYWRGDCRHIALTQHISWRAEHLQRGKYLLGIALVVERLEEVVLPDTRKEPRRHHIIFTIRRRFDGGKIECDADIQWTRRLRADCLRRQSVRPQQMMRDREREREVLHARRMLACHMPQHGSHPWLIVRDPVRDTVA